MGLSEITNEDASQQGFSTIAQVIKNHKIYTLVSFRQMFNDACLILNRARNIGEVNMVSPTRAYFRGVSPQ